ncbi:MAG TPA: nucleotide exchange factor GrpE [Syntrophomonadaceae bacterium]|nr:nucleotide exchange factor GrpE [Syntrophomonadaceae bacterium]
MCDLSKNNQEEVGEKDEPVLISQEVLDEAEDRAKKNMDNYLRALAEIENIRKRNARDREEQYKFASLPVIKKLLPIIDDFERALNTDNNQDVESIYKGMEMILKKLLDVIEAEGVEPIEALGKPFDPEYHQPLMMEKSSQPENTVLEEMEKGYIMNGRVIRPSLVKVSN